MSSLEPLDRSFGRTERLLIAIRQGERSQLGILLDTYRKYLWTIAADRLAQDVAAKIAPSDLVQKTFIEALQGFEDFRGSTELEVREWLKKILANNLTEVHRSYRNSLKRDIGQEVSFHEGQNGVIESLDVPDKGKSPSGYAVLSENSQRLAEALKKLNEEQRVTVQLRSFEQLGFDKIGERLGKTHKAVRKIWTRAVGKLAEELRDHDPGSA